jgi:hypothetical protein
MKNLEAFFLGRGENFQAAWTPPATINLGAKKLCLGIIFINEAVPKLQFWNSFLEFSGKTGPDFRPI